MLSGSIAMGKKFKNQLAIATGVLAIVWGINLPAISQEVEKNSSQKATPVVVESTTKGSINPSAASTVKDVEIPSDELQLLIRPLTLEELQTEAAAWFLILKAKVKENVQTEIAIKRQGGSGDKTQLIEKVTQLQAQQTALIDHFNVVLNELETKGGDVTSYRKYIAAITGIKLDTTSTEGIGLRFINWLKSEEGGIRWAFSFVKFVVIIIVSIAAARILKKVVRTALNRVGNVSTLFLDFIVLTTERGVIVVGSLIALTSLGISLGPLLALVGGVSFVLAFALQSNLSNLASGLMLLIYKPFDVGDEVKVAGYWAYVDSISLANTRLKDFAGNKVTLPNNTIWGSDIINYTHSDKRKLMIPIYVKFTQDLEQIKKLWLDIALSHPKVLKEPAPGWFPWNDHYEYYVSVGLSAWVPTDHFWAVYIELLQAIQISLQEANIELAAPQQDIKLFQGNAQAKMSQE